MAFKLVFGATAAFVLFFTSLPITTAASLGLPINQLPDLSLDIPNVGLENITKSINETLKNSNPNVTNLLEALKNKVQGLNLFEEINELVCKLFNGTPVKPDVVQSRQLINNNTTPNGEVTTPSSVVACNGIDDLMKGIFDLVAFIAKLSTGQSLDPVQTRQIDTSAITSGIELLSKGLSFMDSYLNFTQNAPTN